MINIVARERKCNLKIMQVFVKKQSQKNWKRGNNQRRKIMAKLKKRDQATI